MMDPACEVNEKGTRGKNDGNEVVHVGSSPPLDLDPNEVTEADEETLPCAEEDWQDPEQMEVPKNLEPDLPFTIQTRRMDIFVRGVGVELTHTENFIIKKLKIAREKGDLEAETGEEPKKPDIGRVSESYFNLPNEYSGNIILTYSDFILTNRTCAIAITADMSFRTALAAGFKREYKNIEFLWKQRPGIGGVAALPPSASKVPGKIYASW